VVALTERSSGGIAGPLGSLGPAQQGRVPSHLAPSHLVAELALPALLGLATRVITEAVHIGLAAEGFDDIRPAHGYAFSLIAVRGGATGVEIAAYLGMTKQSAKVLIDQLEAGGYVTRERIARDRRARLVRLTDRGWSCIETGTRLWRDTEASLRESVGGEAVDSTRRVLEQLVAMHIGQDDAIPLRPPH